MNEGSCIVQSGPVKKGDRSKAKAATDYADKLWPTSAQLV